MLEKQKPNEESDNEEQETDGVEDMKVKGNVFKAESVTQAWRDAFKMGPGDGKPYF